MNKQVNIYYVNNFVLDMNTGSWRRKYNMALQQMTDLALVTNFIKGQIIQCLGYILRRKEIDPSLKVAFEWKS